MRREWSCRRYYQQHTGDAARDLPDARLPEYVAKAAIAAMLQAKQGQEQT